VDEGPHGGFAPTTSSKPPHPHPDSLKPILYRLRGRRSNGLPPSKDKRAKTRAALLPDDVTVHDIRRTVADALLNRIGAPPWIVDHQGLTRTLIEKIRVPEPAFTKAADAVSHLD